MPYITMLEGLCEPTVDKQGKKVPAVIKDFVSVCTEVIIDITVTLQKDSGMDDAAIDKLLKMTTTVSTTNMHMFDSERKLHKYASVPEIIEAFYSVRIEVYNTRKTHMVDEMQRKLVKLSNRAKYIQETLNDIVDLRRKSAAQVNALLTGRGYDEIEGDFKYLIRMPMDSVTSENASKIMQEKKDTDKELEALKSTPLETMWLTELAALDTKYDEYKLTRGEVKPKIKVKKSKSP